MKRTLPDRLAITTLLDGHALPSQMVMVTLGMEQKNDYALAFGPTDSCGRIEIASKQLVDAATEERRLFMMDYLDLEAGFTGSITLTVLDLASLDRAIAAWNMFRGVTPYPPGYEVAIRAARQVIMAEPGGNLVALVESDVTGYDVRTPVTYSRL